LGNKGSVNRGDPGHNRSHVLEGVVKKENNVNRSLLGPRDLYKLQSGIGSVNLKRYKRVCRKPRVAEPMLLKLKKEKKNKSESKFWKIHVEARGVQQSPRRQ